MSENSALAPLSLGRDVCAYPNQVENCAAVPRRRCLLRGRAELSAETEQSEGGAVSAARSEFCTWPGCFIFK